MSFPTRTGVGVFVALFCIGLVLVAATSGSTQSGTPSITNLSPSTVRAGTGSLSLIVDGTNFVVGSTVRFAGQNRSTTFISSTRLAASLTSVDTSTVGTFSITVQNPNGLISAARTLTVIPSLSNVSPLIVEVGSPSFTLTVEGDGFVPGSQIRWNGTPVSTTFVNSTKLTALIDDSAVSQLATISITVRNPSPNAFTSNAIDFKVTDPAPATECPVGEASELSNPGKIDFGPARSQMWYNDNLWWGIFSNHVDGLYFYKQAGPTTFTRGNLVDTNFVAGSFSAGWPDVLWNGAELFVFIQESVAEARLYKYSYSQQSQTYSLLQGFPITLPLLGGAASVSIDQDSTGKLWATYAGSGLEGDGNVRVIWSTSPDHLSWNTTGFILASGVSTVTTEAAAIVRFGNRVGVAWSNQNAAEIAFRHHLDGQAETIWSTKEIIDSGLGPQGLGGVADNHLSIRAHPDGRVLLAAKDSDGNGHIHLYVRSTANIWGSKTLIVNDFNAAPTRPQLIVDTDNNQVHVIYKDASVRGGARTYITQSRISNPVFNTPCVIIDTSLSTPTSSNPTTTKQNITATSDLMVAASTGQIGNSILFNRVNITPNVVTIFSLSPKEVTAGESLLSLTLTVNGKLFTENSVVRFNNSNRTTTFFHAGKLTAPISPLLTTNPGSYPVTVNNGGGVISNAVNLVVTAQNPVPVVKSIFPDRFEQGSPTFTITVRGTGFRRTSIVRFNGNNRQTQFVSDTTLTATITAADLGVAGAYPVTVFNPTPGGGTSAVNKLNIFYVQPNCVVPLPTNFPGVTVFNTVKAQMWFNDGLWWGAFSDNVGGVYFYKQSGNTFTQEALIEANYNGRPDVLWNGSNLFILIYEFNTLARLYKFSYDTNNDSYSLIPGFPVNLPLIGMGAGASDAETGSITLAQDTTGKLWAAYPGSFSGGDGNYRVIWSTSADHKTWNTTGYVLASGASIISQEVAPIIHFGGNKIGVAWSNQPAKEIAFRYHIDGEPETTWSTKEVIDSGLGSETGLGGVADNHMSIKAAPDGRVFLLAKDSDGVGYLHLYTRSAAGVWGNPVSVDPDPLAQNTRPALLLDLEQGEVQVLYNNSAEGLMYLNKARMDSPVFPPACPYIDEISASDVTTTKQNLNSETGLWAVASDGGPLSQIYVQSLILAPGSGGNPRPSLNAITPNTAVLGSAPLTLTVNGSNFVNGSIIYFKGMDRATTFVSSTQLTARLFAADLEAVGAHPVKVMNPRGGTSATLIFSISPIISGLSPATVSVGSPEFTLTVNGAGFAAGAVVQINGSNRSTSFVNSSTLTASIPASDVTSVGLRSITVTQSGLTSTPMSFSVINPTPLVSSISPSSVVVGTSTFTLTVNGTGFINSSVVNLNGSPKTTTYVSTTQLTAQIPTADTSSAGQFGVAVTNPAPGGGISNTTNLAVNNPVPTIANISPTSTQAGDNGFTLSVNGTNYNSDTSIHVNGAPRPTTLVSATRVTTQIAGPEIAIGGTIAIQVFNAAPGGGPSNSTNLLVNNPVPTLSGISPPSKLAGDQASTLTITGTSFNASSVVRLNNIERPTSYLGPTQLTADLTAADLAAAGTFSVTVLNPTPGGGSSEPATLTVNNPGPTISSITPSTKIAGDEAFTLAVNGSGFNGSSVVRVNGGARSAVVVDSTQLLVEIPATDLASAGACQIAVFNPTPGGGTSETVHLNVDNPIPQLSGLSPNHVTEGSNGFTLVITGANFNSSSVVLWNGQPRPTLLVSTAELTAEVTGADIFTAGTIPVSVINPEPGGGLSQALSFSIAPNPRIVSVVNGSGAINTSISLPIQIVSQGDENAVGFSLNFDSALLKDPEAALGIDALEATLNVNTSEVSSGRFGVVLSLPAGESFPAGTRHLATVTFQTKAVGVQTDTAIEFIDQPVLREVATVFAEPLPAHFRGGIGTITLGYEGDVSPRPNGSNTGVITIADWAQVGRFAAGLDIAEPGSEFQRADCAPITTRGNGALTIADWAQAGRYASGLDLVLAAEGPNGFAPASQAAQRAPKTNGAVETQSTTTALRLGRTGSNSWLKTSEVAIEIEAEGQENAFGFSLEFDPSRLRYISLTLGAALAAANLIVNEREALEGRVGIALALPSGQGIGSGKHQLLAVTFEVLADGGESSLISFGDQPITREVVDVNARAVKSIFERTQAILDQNQEVLRLKGLDYWARPMLEGVNDLNWVAQLLARIRAIPKP